MTAIGVSMIAFLVSAVCSAVVVRLCRRLAVLDIPNERSSHVTPTPRGGGIGIVVTCSCGFLFLMWQGVLEYELGRVLLLGGLGVATVGYLDDIYSIPAWVRLSVHVIAAVFAFSLVTRSSFLTAAHLSTPLAWIGGIVGVLGIVWTINVFNFMDGIDGIATSEATFVAAAGAVLAGLTGITAGVVLPIVIFAGACAGFLYWNWAPASIFLGDVGSGYLGFLIAVFALAAAASGPIGIPVWLILGALFFADATITLLTRMLRRERFFEAHRSHVYQRLARRLNSHREVSTWLIVINVAVLFPIGLWCARDPSMALGLSIFVLLAVSALMVFLGAGREGS